MQCAPTSLGLVASLPWWHPSTSALPWHGSILGGFDSKRRVNEDERGCTWDGPPPSMPRRLWVLPVLGPMLSLTSCRRLFGGSIQDHQPRVGSACLAHHPTSGSYRLNKGLGAGLATIALIHVGCGAALWLGHQRAEDARSCPNGLHRILYSITCLGVLLFHPGGPHLIAAG